MTALAGWVGIDSRGPTSIYLVSDSRISYFGGGVWDYGRKLFASSRYPEILGYCGDIEFPSLVLGQIIDLIDADLLFNSHDQPGERFAKVSGLLKKSLTGYPPSFKSNFTIAYCTRQGEYMQSDFSVATLSWSPETQWTERWISLPAHSDLILNIGTGQRCVEKWHERWSKTHQKDTSRSVFSAFADCLKNKEVKSVGGAPQLVGMYRKGPAKPFGIIYRGTRYLLGLPCEATEAMAKVKWHNDLFEICDWKTMQRLEDAQAHKRPRGLGKP